MHECDEPAVVFGRGIRARHEHRLAGGPTCAVIEHFRRAGHQVVLQRRPVHRVRIGLRAIPVAILLAGERATVPWELVRSFVDHRHVHRTTGRIDLPPHQLRDRVAEGPEQVIAHHALVEAHVENHLAVGGVVGVEWMEHVPHRNVDPYDVVGRAFTRHEADAIAVLVVPSEREP